jgi:hypothetical protein
MFSVTSARAPLLKITNDFADGAAGSRIGSTRAIVHTAIACWRPVLVGVTLMKAAINVALQCPFPIWCSILATITCSSAIDAAICVSIAAISSGVIAANSRLDS